MRRQSVSGSTCDGTDRLIIAQAVTEGMELVTKDEKIAQYNLKIIW